MAENDNSYMISCPRCGAEMKNNARYCMKCGHLNIDHPKNKGMQKYIAEGDNSYQVGKGQMLGNDRNKYGVSATVATNTGNSIICFIFNLGTYIAVVALLLLGFLPEADDISGLIFSKFPLIVGIVSFVWIYSYSIQILFMKANQRWYAALIPIYNNMVLGTITVESAIMGLLVFVPFVGPFISLYLMYKLGEKFGVSGWLTLFLPIIFIPLIAYGSNLYEGEAYISEFGGTLERDYKLRKIFITITFILGIVGLGLTIWGSTPAVEKAKEYASNGYYVSASNKIVKKIKKAVEKDKITCDGTNFNTDGDKYFYFPEIEAEVFMPLQFYRELTEGYVRVEKHGSEINYYVSLTDRTNGFPETKAEDVSVETVTYFEKLNFDSDRPLCKITN